MADAYKCNECQEYHDGTPAEKVWTGERHASLRAELCPDCSEEFAGGPPEDGDDVGE